MNSKSGKIAGIENVVAFERFIKTRENHGDWGQFILPGCRRLNKSAIAKSAECGFGKSVFVQNPQVRSRFVRLEAELVAEGVLAVEDWSCAGASGKTPIEALSALEEQISNLGDGVSNLKKFIDEVNSKAVEYEAEAKVIVEARSLASKRSR